MSQQPTRLLADIGGTNARFALADHQGVVTNKTYPVRQYPQLIDALRTFLTETGQGAGLQQAALAVAGPQLGDVIQPANSSWVCDPAEIAQVLKLERERVVVLNDFAAVAWALPGLRPADVTALQVGQKSASHPMLTVGPGTGLGIAALVPYTGGWTAVSAEAGHTRYAPANDEERRLVDRIAVQIRAPDGFVTAENLISGPGLVTIYRALSEKPDTAAYEPADIVAKARGGEARALETLRHFSAMFGSFASAAALHYLPLGGVYLTGGVLQKIGDDFAVGHFMERFNTNPIPILRTALQRMPVLRVAAEIPAFVGLQFLLAHNERSA